MDGTVTAGSGTVDESALTGESMPVEKTVGGKAVSATILTGGYLELTADPGRCGYHSVPDHSADGAGRQRQGTYQPSGG